MIEALPKLIVNGEPIPYHTVPVAYMADAMRNYFEHGIPPGSFSRALLSNDLRETFARADDSNSRCVRAWVQWLYNHAPAGSWGSPEKVADWIKERQSARANPENASAEAGA